MFFLFFVRPPLVCRVVEENIDLTLLLFLLAHRTRTGPFSDIKDLVSDLAENLAAFWSFALCSPSTARMEDKSDLEVIDYTLSCLCFLVVNIPGKSWSESLQCCECQRPSFFRRLSREWALNFQIGASPPHCLYQKITLEGTGEKDKRGWMALSRGVC